MMCSVAVVLVSNEFGLCILLGAEGRWQISTGSEDFAGGSAVLPKLSEGSRMELSDLDPVHVTLKGDYLWQVVERVIGGLPFVLQVCFMCLFMSLSRALLQWSELTNMFCPMGQQVNLWTGEVSI